LVAIAATANCSGHRHQKTAARSPEGRFHVLCSSEHEVCFGQFANASGDAQKIMQVGG
jgi:hypothetical protein